VLRYLKGVLAGVGPIFSADESWEKHEKQALLLGNSKKL